MPNLWKFISKSGNEGPSIEDYRFTDAENLFAPLEMDDPPQAEPEPEPEEEPAVPQTFEERLKAAEESAEEDPISFAKLQSEKILQDAQEQADALLDKAKKEIEELRKQTLDKAEKEGYQKGFEKGQAEGTAKAMKESAAAQKAQAERLESEVADFLDKAQETLERQMDENAIQLRDLALAVAEKVVCVSLKSSSDVIGRMIQAAIDKRRRREWVHIYVAECDAKKLAQMPASLMSALSALSDRVRIVPMLDDEPGTCIVEMPDEIVDASAATQLNNIRSMLADTPLRSKETILR